MTTKHDSKSNTKNNIRSSSISPPLYKIEYPNCRTGMYSLRAPFKYSAINEYQESIYTSSPTPTIPHPEYLHVDQKNQQEQPLIRQSLQHDAGVQCSLISLNSRNETDLGRQQTYVTRSYDDDYLSPRYRVQLQLQPIQPNIYEVWDVETPPPRSIPINQPLNRREPSLHVRSPRLVDIEPLSDDESNNSDEEDAIVYAHYPRRSYLPANVRMVCVRQDANTICY